VEELREENRRNFGRVLSRNEPLEVGRKGDFIVEGGERGSDYFWSDNRTGE